MNVEAFLRSAGVAKDQDDVNYLEHVKTSPAGKLFDFEKYYWVSPIVRFKIVTAYESDIKFSGLISPEEKTKYLDMKLGYILDQLEEEHEFLMSIKDIPLTDYLSRMRYESEFLKMNYLVNLYDHEVNTYGFETYEKRIEQNRSGEDKKFKKMNLTSTILLIIALIIAVILVASVAETISIITSVAAAIVCVIQKIVVGGFHRKGFAE